MFVPPELSGRANVGLFYSGAPKVKIPTFGFAKHGPPGE
jgi:hypothetical protein